MHTRDNDTLARWRREARRALPSADLDLIEEVAQHVTDRWLRARALGADTAEADRQAAADLAAWRGRPAPSRAPSWRRAALWLGWGADVRTALRALRVRPIFTVGATVLSTIAVTAIVCGFAIVYGILWRPLAYPDAERLAVLWQVRGAEQSQISYPDFADVSSATVFASAAAISGGRGSLRIGDAIERINVLGIEAPGLAMLGARPHLGRLLTADDADQPVAMISYRLWTTKLGSDPNIIGRLLWLSGSTRTVVGVLQPGFDFELPVPPSFRLEKNEMWMVLERKFPPRARRDFSGYEALVKLAPGRTLAEAQAAADATAARLAAEHPATNAGRTFRVSPLKDEVVAPVRQPLLFVMLAGAVALGVAAANLVILGLVRGAERQGEMAIRTALGAGAFRIRRQLFTENALIALCGAGLGLLFARQIAGALIRSEAAHLPRADAIRFDLPVWLAAAAVAALITVALMPHSVRVHATWLRSGSRTAGQTVRRSRRLMVATEIAMALALTAGGALLGLSLSRLLAVDPGFEAAGTAAARVSAYAARYPTKDHVVGFFDTVLERMRDMPGVAAVGAGLSVPLSGQTSGTAIVAEGRPLDPGARPTAGWQFVTPRYLEAAGMRIVAGRDFTPADRGREGHVTIISEEVARLLFPGENPIGRRIGVGGGDTQGDWHEVIGVVAGVRHTALDRAPEPRVYDLFGQHWGRSMFVVARSRTADAAPLVAAVRRTVAALDPEAPVFEAATMEELVDRSAAARRLAATLAIGLAAVGVLLALIGVYAVTAASVSERYREIGVRAALGAGPRDLFALIAGESAWTALAGGLAGIAGSIGLVRLIEAELFGVRAADAWWLLPLVTSGVLLAAFLAAVPPGRRAARADPLAAMRQE